MPNEEMRAAMLAEIERYQGLGKRQPGDIDTVDVQKQFAVSCTTAARYLSQMEKGAGWVKVGIIENGRAKHVWRKPDTAN